MKPLQSLNVIIVNVGLSVRADDIKQAASGPQYADGSQQQEQLRKADLVLAASGNTIRGVYRPVSVVSEPHESRQTAENITWELEEAPAYSSLVGHDLLETRWKQGLARGWLSLPDEEFKEIFKKAIEGKLPLGPHEALLRPDGSLELWAAEGYELFIHTIGQPPRAKQRIEDVVKRMTEVGALATYRTIGQMLGINSAQSVGRSIARNDNISAVEAANVLDYNYREGKYWLVPMSDDKDWFVPPTETDKRSRAEILIDKGLATQDGDYAVIEDAMVIKDGATLRRYLNI